MTLYERLFALEKAGAALVCRECGGQGIKLHLDAKCSVCHYTIEPEPKHCKACDRNRMLGKGRLKAGLFLVMLGASLCILALLRGS